MKLGTAASKPESVITTRHFKFKITEILKEMGAFIEDDESVQSSIAGPTLWVTVTKTEKAKP